MAHISDDDANMNKKKEIKSGKCQMEWKNMKYLRATEWQNDRECMFVCECVFTNDEHNTMNSRRCVGAIDHTQRNELL